MANDKNKPAGAPVATNKSASTSTPASGAKLADVPAGVAMQDWQGRYGGNVDGWFSPPDEIDHPITVRGVLSNYIPSDRSEKLQSDSLVLELTDPVAFCKNGGSEAMPGEKDDKKLHTAPPSCMIGVPVWKQLEGMWPKKAGHLVHITIMGNKKSIGKGRSMYPIKVQCSDKPVKHVEIFEDEGSDAADFPPTPPAGYKVDSAS